MMMLMLFVETFRPSFFCSLYCVVVSLYITFNDDDDDDNDIKEV